MSNLMTLKDTVIPLFLALGLTLTVPNPAPATAAGASPQAVACPAATPQGRRLVVNFASSELYANNRERRGIVRAEAAQVRPLVDRHDAAACGRLMQALIQRANDAGGTLGDSRPEFYAAGAYYFAVIPASPSRCRARPGFVCIDTRWQALDVFDRDFVLIAALAV